MRIALFSDNFYPELGGIQDSIAITARELGERGHDVDLYVPRAHPRDFELIGIPVREIDLGSRVRIHRLLSVSYPSPTNQSRGVIPTGLQWLRLLKVHRPDVIHSHTFFSVGVEALIAAKILRIPFVGTNHFAISEFGRYVPIPNGAFREMSLSLVSRYYNQCRFVSAPSESVLVEMKKYGFVRPSAVISNPIHPVFFNDGVLASERINTRARYGMNGPAIVYAGRLAEEKYIDVVMRAFAHVKREIPAADFFLAGHGTDKARLLALARELGMESSVHFVGTLSPSELAVLFQAADIFAIASTSETQSMVLLQAMAAGLPALGVRARALPEYIDEGVTGFLATPGDDLQMSEQMLLLCKDEPLRREYGARARSRVSGYSATRVADEWEKIYRSAQNISS